MSFSRRQFTLIALFLLTIDIGCITFAAVMAGFLHPEVDSLALAWRLFTENSVYFSIVYIIWFIVGWSQGMFVSHRRDPLSSQLYYVVKAVLITLLLGYFVVDFVADVPVDGRYALNFGILALVTIGAWRTALCLGLWLLRQRGFNARHVLVVGANERIARLLAIIEEHAQFGYNIIGVVDDDAERMSYLERFNVPYLGKLDDMEGILAERVVDEVHVGLPVRSCYETIQELADLCLGVGVSMRMVADLFPLQLATSRVHSLEGVPMLSLTMVSENTTQLAMKRLVDFVGALSLLIVLSPLLLTVAVLIKLTSSGPVFFRQERVGRNQRKFQMIKFRSMVVDAEARKAELTRKNEVDGPIFKIKNDPRVTKVGRFIRKYSIDELPQLFNVLKGEMSLVGPRPHPTQEVEQYTWHHRRRLSVKPGMTGLAQVSGRSELRWDACVDLDLTYIDTWSLATDIWILFRTCKVVATGEGAS